MKKAIYFDMDGTIAALFYVKGWKEAIENNDATPYRAAKPLFKAEEMREAIARLKKLGYTIGIITYVAYGCTNAFAEEIKQAKSEWLDKYFPYADEVHMVSHDIPKHEVAEIHNSILVDDAKANREAWTWGDTINAYRANLVAELNKIERWTSALFFCL